jgi:hypothetical protein
MRLLHFAAAPRCHVLAHIARRSLAMGISAGKHFSLDRMF